MFAAKRRPRLIEIAIRLICIALRTSFGDLFLTPRRWRMTETEFERPCECFG